LQASKPREIATLISLAWAATVLLFDKFMNLLKKSLAVEPDGTAATIGHLFFRISAGLMIFYIHGLHKLEGWIAYLQHGTPWILAGEVAGMHMPAPLASAVAATLVQFICSLFIIVGMFTRINAALLVCALSGAILQNLLAGRDPQLAILYTLVVVTLIFIGGGKYSLDARLLSITERQTPEQI
jgi:putative oxidoreductase